MVLEGSGGCSAIGEKSAFRRAVAAAAQVCLATPPNRVLLVTDYEATLARLEHAKCRGSDVLDEIPTLRALEGLPPTTVLHARSHENCRLLNLADEIMNAAFRRFRPFIRSFRLPVAISHADFKIMLKDAVAASELTSEEQLGPFSHSSRNLGRFGLDRKKIKTFFRAIQEDRETQSSLAAIICDTAFCPLGPSTRRQCLCGHPGADLHHVMLCPCFVNTPEPVSFALENKEKLGLLISGF